MLRYWKLTNLKYRQSCKLGGSEHSKHLLSMLFMKFPLACWIPGIYFFLEKVKSTGKTPAQSRNQNVECILGDLYDHHDVWHFLSAAGLFFSFILLLVLDDGIDHVPRNRILIF